MMVDNTNNHYDPDVFDAMTRKDWEKQKRLFQCSHEDLLKFNETEKEELKEKLNTYVLEKGKPSPNAPKLHEMINVVLFGKTGHGKSSTANTIAGEPHFPTSGRPGSCTQVITVKEMTFNDQKYKIIDTPGFFDTVVKPADIKFEICKVIDECRQGIHVFLYVYNGGTRFSPEEQETIKEIEGLFGKEVNQYSALILTHGKEFLHDRNIEMYIESCENVPPLHDFINEIDQRILAVDNLREEKFAKTFTQKAIFDLIQKVQEHVGYKAYTHLLFEMAKKTRNEEEERRKQRADAHKLAEKQRMASVLSTIEKTASEAACNYFDSLSWEMIKAEKGNDYEKSRRHVRVILEENISQEDVGIVDMLAGINGIVEKSVLIVANQKEIAARECVQRREIEEAEKEREQLFARLKVEKNQEIQNDELGKVYHEQIEKMKEMEEKYQAEIKRMERENNAKMKAMEEDWSNRLEMATIKKDNLESVVKDIISKKAKKYVMGHSKSELEKMTDSDLAEFAKGITDEIPPDGLSYFSDNIIPWLGEAISHFVGSMNIGTRILSGILRVGKKLWSFFFG